jgi:hypothetical protein
MLMKTKEKYKKSGSADRRFCGLRLFHDPLEGRGPQTRRSALHQNWGNKARMYMKTNSRGVQESKSREVVRQNQEVESDGFGLSLLDFQLSTLNCLTRIRRNKARMFMKTKDEDK